MPPPIRGAALLPPAAGAERCTTWGSDVRVVAAPRKAEYRRRVERRGSMRAMYVTRMIVIALAIAACSSSRAAAPESHADHAFYFWRSTLQLSATEKQTLIDQHVNRLYVRAFDLGWNPRAAARGRDGRPRGHRRATCPDGARRVHPAGRLRAHAIRGDPRARAAHVGHPSSRARRSWGRRPSCSSIVIGRIARATTTSRSSPR